MAATTTTTIHRLLLFVTYGLCLICLDLTSAFPLPAFGRSATSPVASATPSTVHLYSYLDSLNGGGGSNSIDPVVTAPTPPSPSQEFQQVPILSLKHADAIASAAIGVCERNGFNPVTVVVLDASGSPLVSKRMDGCSPVVVADMALSKANSCIVNKYPSRTFRDRYTAEPNQAAKFCQLTSMVAISQGRMAPFPGGILLEYGEYIMGAVGVSGAAGDEDEYCAIQGVMEASIPGLTTVPETHSCTTVKD